LKLAVIGVGQAGGRIADLFERYDHENRKIHGRNISISMAINTSKSDLLGLRLISTNNRLLIGQSGVKGHGVGADIDLGAKVAKQELGTIKKTLGEKGAHSTLNADAFLFISGLGGGTGSGGVPVFADEIKRYGVPVIALGILPSDDEGGLMALNATRSLIALQEVSDAVILFDNNMWRMRGLPIEDSYRRMNRKIVQMFPYLLGAGEADTAAKVGVKVLEASDILNTLKGFTVLGYSEALAAGFRPFRKKTAIDRLHPKDKCRSVIQNAANTLTADCVPPSATKALMLLAGPPDELSRDGFDEARVWLHDKIQGGTELRAGDYPMPKSDKLVGVICFSGLTKIPRVTTLLNKAVTYAKTLKAKEKIEPLLEEKLKHGKYLMPPEGRQITTYSCPKCESKNIQTGKTWDVIPTTGRGRPMRVTLISCRSCGHKFRKASKIED